MSTHLTEWAEHNPHRAAATVYLYVSHADTLYEQWTNAGVAGRFVKPHDTPYRLREFAYIDPDGTALRVGSPLPSRALPSPDP